MSEDERRRFALEEEEGTDDRPAELAFEEPRKEDSGVVRKASQQEDQESSESE